MLLRKTEQRNPHLLKVAEGFHQEGKIRPDSYCIDVDQFVENAAGMLDEAVQHNIKLYFMLKQVGRNPELAKRLMKLGYEGAVVVDYKEAKVMMDHDIPLGNVGHLVQIPDAFLEEVILYRPEVITVYSIEKVKKINAICKKHNLKQSILIRVVDSNDMIYSGQEAGICLDQLEEFVTQVKALDHIIIDGITVFPAVLYQCESKQFEPTHNTETVAQAKIILENHGIDIQQINLPSATCTQSLPLIKSLQGTHGEPGHGLSGSTPAHADLDLEEKPCVVYVSEVSHHFNGNSYCYGGGHYRRSHMKFAKVDGDKVEVIAPSVESIDYHFGLKGIHPIGKTVLMAFRFQIFVTRSDVVLIEGIQKGNPSIVGIYDAIGKELSL